MAEVPEHPFGTCANCGKPFRYDVEYPVTTIEEDDLQIYSFCDEQCQAEWEMERGLR